ncbi:MAG: DUF3035 domain-containing protein [Pseudomonadota bacterium]
MATNPRLRAGALLGAGLATALLLGLSGCGGQQFNLRKELGLVGAGPDEFTVVKRKPLALPGDQPQTVDDLPPPRPGAPSPLDPTPEQDAQRALTGDVASGTSEASATEQSLLSQAGAENADDSIRTTLETERDNELEGTMVDQVMNEVVTAIKGSDPSQADALDPAAEAKRLAEEQGRPVPAGGAPAAPE